MLPSTNSWSSNCGSNFLPGSSNSLSNFGDRNHRLSVPPTHPSSHPWGGLRPHETGFVPPPIDLRYQSDNGCGWPSSSVSSRTSVAGFTVKDELSDGSDYSSEDTCSDYRDTSTGANPGEKVRRSGAERRPDIEESMTPEEVEKRRVRRERNKMAAARCRQRRVDLTNQLLVETESLEDERDRLQKEIQSLQRQRAQLEDLLGAHAPRCKSRSLINSHVIDIPPIKTEKSDDDVYINMADTGLRGAPYSSYSLPATTFHSCSRPDSLPLTRRPVPMTTAGGLGQTLLAPGGGGGGAVASVTNLGLDCMLDGHTGLTPITGAAPLQEHIGRSPVDCGGYSPTMLMTL